MKLIRGMPKEGPYWMTGKGSPIQEKLSVPLQAQPRRPSGVIRSHHW
jgi:hypothetical protein